MSRQRTFFGAFALGVALALGLVAYDRYFGLGIPPEDDTQSETALHLIAPYVYVAAQLRPSDFSHLRSAGIKSLIDLRPDGESADQPASAEMASMAAAFGLGFRYEPTPHGPVSASRLASFKKSFDESARPVVLYCHSGARAARMWALTAAAQPHGPTANDIMRSAAAADLPVESLRAEIEDIVRRRQALEPTR